MTTTGSTAASSSDQKEHSSAAPQASLRQTGAAASATTRALSLEALFATILQNLKLLLLGPVIVGLVAFGIVNVLPKWYTSVAYLNLDEAGARAADALMHSPPVLDKVLAELKPPQNTVEARRAFLNGNRRIVVAAGELQRTSGLYRLEYSDRDPRVAQRVNLLFIEAWLESTKPPPEKRATIEAEIARRDLRAKSVSQLIDRLQKDATSLVSQNSQEGELATPLTKLIEKRDENLATIADLRNSLNGVSHDVVFSAPDLPEEPSWPKKGMITILAGFVAGLLLLMFVILRPFWPVRT
ncbi:MAG: hypothetical protein ACLQDM_19260 [Bradyrhizobium sp.]